MSNTTILFRRRHSGVYTPPSLDLRIIAVEALTITFSQRGTGSAEYSLDRSQWTPFVSGQPTTTFPAGSTIYLRGNLVPFVSSTFGTSGIGNIDASGLYRVAGCPLSLLGQSYSLSDDIPAYAFAGLFASSQNLISADGLLMPTGEVKQRGCWGMFNTCSNLSAAPALPSTTIGESAYRGAFRSTALTQTPVLPATIVADYAYSSMFFGCTGIVSAGAIYATQINAYGCWGMFSGCSSLSYVPDMAATTINEMGCSEMFRGCSALVVAPEIPATALGNRAFQWLFINCTSLQEIRVHFTTWNIATNEWVQGVPSGGTIYCPASLPAQYGVSAIPTGWTKIDI